MRILDVFVRHASPLTPTLFPPGRGGLAALLIVVVAGANVIAQSTQPIDRHAVVSRHSVTMTSFDPLSPLSVGNGEFAFTVDPTGLQTFPDIYEKFTPLCTQSQWGWHSIPMPAELKGQQLRYSEYETYGRKVGYMTSQRGQEALFNWARENPHRLHLGRIALEMRKADGSAAKPEDLKNVRQTLDLWTGIIESTFELDGAPVRVQTCCTGEEDGVAVRVESTLIEQSRLNVAILFPYGSADRDAADWNRPDAHQTAVVGQIQNAEGRLELSRALDDSRYLVSLAWSSQTQVQADGRHRWLVRGNG